MRQKSALRDAQQRTITALYEGIWADPADNNITAAGAILPMGGGKTASALTAFAELQADNLSRDMFVLAPKRVAQLVWRNEVKEWAHLQKLRVAFVGGSAANREKLLSMPYDIYCVGQDNTQWFVTWAAKQPRGRFDHSVLCIDESSRFKNPRGKRLRALFSYLYRNPKAFMSIWELTGTPRPNGEEDLFGQLKIATRGKLWGKSFDRWRERHFYPTDWNQHNWAILPELKPRIVEDTNKVFITLRPEDMPELPDLNDGPEHIRWVDLPKEIVDRYKEMERHLINELKSRRGEGDHNMVIAANQAVASGKLAQICQGFLYAGGPKNREAERFHDLKMEALHDMLYETGGEPVMVAYDFQADLDRLRDEFPGLKYLGAGIKDREAEEFERAWNRGDMEIAALHPASAGHGLNLQFGGSRLIHYGLTWSAELYDQLLKRFHRPGQHAPVWSHPILARAQGLWTVDQMKYERVHDKMTAQQLFNRLIKEV